MNDGPNCVVVDGGGARRSTWREAVNRAAEAGVEGGTDSHGAGEVGH